jgi:hypothetical protein
MPSQASEAAIARRLSLPPLGFLPAKRFARATARRGSREALAAFASARLAFLPLAGGF